jgi:cytochrome c oxidase subunit IV
MSSHGHISHSNSPVREIPAPQTAWIFKTFWILSAITAFEFLIAFTKGPDVLNLNHYVVVTIFVSLTLVKAFYIVADFMHLKHEAKMLISVIVFPTLFIMWLILALLIEGHYTLAMHHFFR